MSTLAIRQLDERLPGPGEARRSTAARFEAEVRAVLDAAVSVPTQNFLLSFNAAMAEAGGVELNLLGRTNQPRSVDLL